MKKNQTKEIWVPAIYVQENGNIIDFTCLYAVSDQGRVKSLNYRHTGKAKVMKVCSQNDAYGYLYYAASLCKNNKTYRVFIHRLVLSSFDPKGFKPGDIVNHKVERTSDSCIDALWNLEWCSRKANVSTEHCRNAQSKAQVNHPAKSKRIRVTNLTTNETIEYPSAHEVIRALNIHVCISGYIKHQKGYYRKGNLHFAYV